MKKHFLMIAAVAMGLTFTACSDNDSNSNGKTAAEIIAEIDAEDNVDYTSSNASAWGNYMNVVAQLLSQDATTLYNDWTVSYQKGDSYASQFKNHQVSGLQSGLACVEQLITGMADIANEVGEAKIGDPLTLYTTNWMKKENMKEGLYAVESWYSWHSRDDYSNNILSIRNCYYGVYDKSRTTKSAAAANSMYTTVNSLDPALNAKIVAAIEEAMNAIQAIPQPFRNNINSSEAYAAQAACAALTSLLETDLPNFFQNSASSNEICDPIVANVVDNVIVPTSKDLMDLNKALLAKVVDFRQAPTTAKFSALGDAWIASRQPWESFEAFLFGPVSDDGLDPNMDSWPLDRDGIVNLLASQKFSEMEWDGEYDEESEKIAAAQGLRGFHTLEFLIFKNGKTRTVQ